jgi:hypothetical protein
MATDLSEIQPKELSLVRRGAVRRPWLFAKEDEPQELAIDAETLAVLAKEHGVKPGDIAKAMGAAADDDEDAELETDEEVCKAFEDVVKADFTAEQRAAMAKNGQALPDGSYPIPNRDYLEKAIHAIGRGKNNSHDSIRQHIVKRAKALGATSLLPDDWNIKKEDGMTETAQAVPVKKEDGSWDLSAVPEDQRPALELVLKTHDDELAELRKANETEKSKADEAIEIAKAERDARETREYIAKSESLDKLAKDDSEFGEVLKSIARAEAEKHLPEGTVEKLDTVLAAANEAVEKGALFMELGRAGHGESSDVEKQLDAKADEIRKSEPSLTKEQALEKAYNDNPELYSKLREGSVA